ncbi:MAG TPA: aldehyde dehydrogenase family protein [Bradyrhizobium sp.]|jgi:aldehyde dehydrogenase (NAD(P)+)|nr:aldehyde dehydrogenase family protein [Bradyrhizobium sp.]
MSSETSFAQTVASGPQGTMDQALRELADNKLKWARTSPADRLKLLEAVKTATYEVAAEWADLSADQKGIPEGSPLAGEEWTSGPWAMLAGIDNYCFTLANIEGNRHIAGLKKRKGGHDQTIVNVFPHSIFDRLLLSGVYADVWMERGVTPANLSENTAAAYREPVGARTGKLSLVLGAGNISSISPLDVLHKLIAEHAVVVLKLNPVNAYLHDVLYASLYPLIDRGFVRIVRGATDVGQYLCNHPLVEDIHITGSAASYDAIVFGTGTEGRRRKEANDPVNKRPISSELGAVCPTIVVPGPWTKADLRFQAEQVASQKLHNSGFNCVACQILVMPKEWPQTEAFRAELHNVLAGASKRALYYPGAKQRLADFTTNFSEAARSAVSGGSCVVVPLRETNDSHVTQNEVFAPALGEVLLPGANAEPYLREAVRYCNENLRGTLGANIVIHPRTRAELGDRFEQIIADLHYGCIAVNAWTGLGFLLTQTPWGAFPGHAQNDIQSGTGFVHNTLLFDRVERTVVYAPFRPFPRNLLHGSMTLLPRPPWFITNKRADKIGRRLVEFQYRPSWLKLPGIFFDALLG